MSATFPTLQRREPGYAGLRMTAADWFQLDEDGFDYELVNGVVVMSPSPTPKHQHVALEIATQLKNYLRKHPVGVVFVETDVHLGKSPGGDDLVYRPDVLFIEAARVADLGERIVGPPAVVVEIVSAGSRRFDNETKKEDYERCGVQEFWLIDPERSQMVFYRLDADRYVESPATGDAFASTVITGFRLDLARLREAFSSW